jgi:hypothetical protein
MNFWLHKIDSVTYFYKRYIGEYGEQIIAGNPINYFLKIAIS